MSTATIPVQQHRPRRGVIVAGIALSVAAVTVVGLELARSNDHAAKPASTPVAAASNIQSARAVESPLADSNLNRVTANVAGSVSAGSVAADVPVYQRMPAGWPATE